MEELRICHLQQHAEKYHPILFSAYDILTRCHNSLLFFHVSTECSFWAWNVGLQEKKLEVDYIVVKAILLRIVI